MKQIFAVKITIKVTVLGDIHLIMFYVYVDLYKTFQKILLVSSLNVISSVKINLVQLYYYI